MNVINWLSEKVAERISTIIGGLMVSKAERAALQSHVDDLENIETRAKQLEDSGNSELAEYLRTQARRLTNDGPGAAADSVLTCLAASSYPAETRESHSTAIEFTGSEKPAGKKKRGRPKKSALSNATDSGSKAGGAE
ncbi:MAG: hypothetical protein WBD31_05270 [Rubripirellula sp.]